MVFMIFMILNFLFIGVWMVTSAPGYDAGVPLCMNTHRWPHTALGPPYLLSGHHTHCRHQIVARLPANWGFICSLGVCNIKIKIKICSAELSAPDCVPLPAAFHQQP